MRTVPAVPTLLGRVVVVEIRKLFASRLAWAGWLFLAAMTAIVVFVVDLLVVNAPAAGAPQTLPGALTATLAFRGLFIGQIWLTVLAASSFAGEYVTRALREDVATGVPRWALLLGKWTALGAWSGVSLVGQVVLGIVFGIGVLELGSGWGSLLWALAGALAADVSFLALALLVAVGVRRVAASIVAVLLFMGIERGLMYGLYVLSSLDPSVTEWMLPGVPVADIGAVLLPWFPANAWGIGLSLAVDSTIEGATWVALALYTAVCAGAAGLWFERLDLP